MTNKWGYGLGGVLAGALVTTALAAFTGVSPADALPSVPQIAQNIVSAKAGLKEKCDSFQTKFNSLLEDAGAEGKVRAHIVPGTYDQPYGKCWVEIKSGPGETLVGAFDHNSYLDIYKTGGKTISRAKFIESVVNAFSQDDIKKIGKVSLTLN